MKNNLKRILSVGCICTMLLSPNAFAVPAEDDAYIEPTDATITLDIDDNAQTTASDNSSTSDSISVDTEMVDPPLDDSLIGPGVPCDVVFDVNTGVSPISDLQIVALKDCKLYADHGTSSGVVGTMKKGLVRTVLDSQGNFHKVKVDGENVWVHVNNVANVADKTIKVIANSDCNVYSQASTTSDVVTVIPQGTERTVLNYSGNFYKIKMNGLLGWVKMNSGDFSITITNKIVTTTVYDEIAELALQQKGKSYVSGATGPNSFDCSGLVYYCYGQKGITVPRTSANQYAGCISVSRSELKPGYLIFFHTTEGSNAVSHVGIYLGDNQFVHASTPSTGVIVSNLTENYYVNHIVGYGYYA